MNNFQLYRTNVLLSGQMKWDLIIDSSYDDLYITDFHLTPISPNIPFVYKSDEYLVKNSHQDNIKNFYSINKGHFYSEYLNSDFYHSWPLICNENEKLASYSNIYDMGCKRSKSFKKYNKQFEYFCPVWIEHLTENISFKIIVKNADSDIVLSSRVLELKNKNKEFHDKFVNYYNTYIEDSNILKGNDNVLNIIFKNNDSYINGLNASSGLFETKHITTLISNLTSRERPLMESDSLLTYTFSDNSMICPQLFNFNICFNLEDILPGNITKLMSAKDIKVNVDTYIGNTLLEKRDFYTEYDYIDRSVKNSKINEEYNENVLDYLRDNRCLNLIDKNKFCQSICHWSLNDNSDYIFNVYEGFSGIYKDGDNIYENSHQYGFTPDTNVTKKSKSKNIFGWINTYKVNTWTTFNKYIENTDKYKTMGTYVDMSKNNFINGLKYASVPKNLINNYIIGIIVSNELLDIIKNNYNPTEIFDYEFNAVKSSAYIMQKNDLIFIITNNEELLIFKNFYKICKKCVESKNEEPIEPVICYLYEMMKKVIQPKLILFDNSINYTKAASPNVNSEEIEYIKNNNLFNYIFRYDGKLKPTFTIIPSTLYYKDYVSNTKMKHTPYIMYSNSKYEPLYPSIGYCGIKKIGNYSYDKMPLVKFSEFDENISLYNDFEYSWFNDNKVLVLDSEIEFTHINTKENGYDSLDDIIYEYIKTYYNIEDKFKIEYIKSLYEYKNSWEYLSDTNIDDYTYNIKLKLK